MILSEFLIAGHNKPGYFDQADNEMLIDYASQAIIIIQNSLLETERRRLYSEMHLTNSSIKAIASVKSAENINSILNSIVTSSVELLEATGGLIYVRVPGENKLELKVANGINKAILSPSMKFNYSQGIAGQVIAEGKAILFKRHCKIF